MARVMPLTAAGATLDMTLMTPHAPICSSVIICCVMPSSPLRMANSGPQSRRVRRMFSRLPVASFTLVTLGQLSLRMARSSGRS